MKYTIPVVTRTQDNGDGGWTTYAYNSKEELIKNHPKSRKWKTVKGKLQEVTIELTQEQKDEILNEDDPYCNGYIGEDEIAIEITDGKAVLSKPLSFHAGQ